MPPSVYYQGGTLVLKGVTRSRHAAAPFQWIKERWRCEGYHYPALLDWFRAQGIRDTMPRCCYANAGRCALMYTRRSSTPC